MKRLIGLRSLIFVSAIAVVISVRSWVIGLDLEIGGLLGIANLYLATRANERFLDGRSGRAMRMSQNLQRILILAAVPVVITRFSPVWAMAVTFGGIFTPLALYTLELHRRYRTGDM